MNSLKKYFGPYHGSLKLMSWVQLATVIYEGRLKYSLKALGKAENKPNSIKQG
jgi:hypothetical protein